MTLDSPRSGRPNFVSAIRLDASRIQIGSVGDLGQPEISGKEELLRFRFTFDDMDAPIIPRQGVRAEVKADWLLEAPEAKEEF